MFQTCSRFSLLVVLLAASVAITFAQNTTSSDLMPHLNFIRHLPSIAVLRGNIPVRSLALLSPVENILRSSTRGMISWRHRRIFIGEAFALERLTFWPAEGSRWEIYFGAICLGFVDEDKPDLGFVPVRRPRKTTMRLNLEEELSWRYEKQTLPISALTPNSTMGPQNQTQPDRKPPQKTMDTAGLMDKRRRLPTALGQPADGPADEPADGLPTVSTVSAASGSACAFHKKGKQPDRKRPDKQPSQSVRDVSG